MRWPGQGAREWVGPRTRSVLPPYVLSRVLVLGSLVLTRHVVSALHAVAPVQTRDGLLGWDADWYRHIARGGYGDVAKEGLRFFPLVPALAKAVSWMAGIGVDLALLLVVEASALAVGLLVYELVLAEGRGDALARRAVWIAFLAPPAFVLVMGYAEATLMTAALVSLLALRRGRWWIAAIAGIFAGLTRPVGVLLVVPALVEVVRTRTELRAREGATGHDWSAARGWLARACAVTAPVVGAGAYLVWAEHRSGDVLYPLSVQQASSRRGGWIDPVRAVGHVAGQVVAGDHLSEVAHLVTAGALVVLLVVLARRWPVSFTAYALAAVIVGLSARNLDSLERYSLSTVPLVLAAADVVGGGTRERVVLVALGATLVAASVLAFTGVLVP